MKHLNRDELSLSTAATFRCLPGHRHFNQNMDFWISQKTQNQKACLQRKILVTYLDIQFAQFERMRVESEKCSNNETEFF